MKSEDKVKMHKRLSELSTKEIDLLRSFAYSIVDTSLHNMLFMFQENAEWKLSNPSLAIDDLNAESDGLAGELYTTDGWIRQFSDYEPSEGL